MTQSTHSILLMLSR